MKRTSFIITIAGLVIILLGAFAGYYYVRFNEIPFILKKKQVVQDTTKNGDFVTDSGKLLTKLIPISSKDTLKNLLNSFSISDTTTFARSSFRQPIDTTSSIQSSSGVSSLNQTQSQPQVPLDPKEKKKLIKLYESMSPEKVAEILEMTKDDSKVREVIMMLNHRSAGKILQLLPPERIQKIMGLKTELQ